ncbi:Uncharacterised protein [Candidatus Ornithobacterium hominis]|uniref:hypothetical protein n=1 Tax=Candidatus Ornithobacterium hominis TaxID=2497989 RepID=UPI000E5B46A2|nr:hypothetical protein [Candidatus Ornithobacterium hominis]SZD71837.1 Uncharacterised protein [Candidatus Ornithobacterium hominis]
MKYLLFFLSLIFFFSCKNIPEKSPKDFAIQNTTSGKVLLRFHPKLNDQLEMMTLFLVDRPGDKNSKLDLSLEYKMRITATEDSLYTYTIDMQRVILNSEIDGLALKYDSSREDNGLAQVLGEQIKPILASQFTLQITDKAEVKNIEWQNQKIGLPFDQMAFSSIAIPLPNEPVGVKDQWKEEINVNGITTEMVFKVEEITPNEVKINLHGKEKAKESTKLDGYYVLDRKTSFTKSGEINIYLKKERQMQIIFKAL